MGINRSIKNKLFCLLILIGALPLIIVISLGANNMINDLEETAKSKGLLRNLMVSEHVAELLQKNFYVLHAVALEPIIIDYVQKPSPELERIIFKRLNDINDLFDDNNLSAITAANADQLIRTDNSSLVNIKKRRHFKEAMQGNDFVSDVIVSMSTGEKIVVLEVPIKDENGKPIGLLQRNFDLSALQDFVETQDDDKNSVVILDRSGAVVATSNEIQKLSTAHVGDLSYATLADEIKDNFGVRRMNIDHEDSLVIYARSELTDWLILSIQPYHFILDQVYNKIAQAVFIGFLMLSIVGTAAYFLSIKFTKPIVEITKAAEEIVSGNGDIYNLEIMSNDELGKMAEAFNKIRLARDAYQLESELDKLTKLYNKTTMANLCKRKLQKSKEFNNDRFMALYVIDLDHFKEVNDTFGHQFGDEVLKEFARKLRKSFRPKDCIGRFGGDEFVVIIDNLPDINVVVRKAKQLNIVARNIIVDDIITGISASIGIAIAPYQGEDYETLFKAADEALYHVKQHGRNGYHCLLFDEESTNEKNFTF